MLDSNNLLWMSVKCKKHNQFDILPHDGMARCELTSPGKLKLILLAHMRTRCDLIVDSFQWKQ